MKKVLGQDHFEVAISLNNQAALYCAQGKYLEAEPLFKQSLVIMEQAFGKDHPIVATVLENMTECYKKLGRESEAEKLEERVKAIRSKDSDYTSISSHYSANLPY